jgi:hypothetical protein
LVGPVATGGLPCVRSHLVQLLQDAYRRVIVDKAQDLRGRPVARAVR